MLFIAVMSMVSNLPNRRFSLAPMMDWSDKHCRTFWRGITKEALLYTEMVTTGAILHGDSARFLDFNAGEEPLALQLGGSNPADLARCAELAEQWQYQEVNLNCGCPSDRVRNGAFGACLMGNAELVANCYQAMQEATTLPVTIKHRIGIDDQDSYEFLTHFVETIANKGCQTFIVHARKAILGGLSPKQNREIPPLIYDRVYQLKQDYPELEIIINGGINNLDEAETHLQHVDGVMIGREAYGNPWHMHDVDRRFFDKANPSASRQEVMDKFLPYWAEQCEQGLPLSRISRHIIGLYHRQPGGKQFRRFLSEACQHGNTDINVVYQALTQVEQFQNAS